MTFAPLDRAAHRGADAIILSCSASMLTTGRGAPGPRLGGMAPDWLTRRYCAAPYRSAHAVQRFGIFFLRPFPRTHGTYTTLGALRRARASRSPA